MSGVFRPREITPQRIVRELLKCVSCRCCVCKAPATKHASLKLIFADPSYFCDAHSFLNVPRYENAVVDYNDIGNAQLIRDAEKWLQDNLIEEKT